MSSLPALFSSLWRNRHLIVQLSQREVVGRYRGSALGILWSIILPLLMLAVYTFIFSVIFKARWGIESDNKFDFAVILFCGLIAFNLFSECLQRAPTIILNNAVYVKKVVFPLEILPWTTMGAALFYAAMNLLVLLGFSAVSSHQLHWTIALYPLVLLPLILSTMGLSWFLASLGVFVRDITHVVGVITSVLLFLTPIFYPLDAVPEGFRVLLMMNPLTYVVEQSRNVLLWGVLPRWEELGLYLVASLMIAWLGFFWFQKTKKGFADVV